MVIERFNLTGRVVVITGGSGLLGRKHAEAVIEAGGIPVIVDIDKEKTKRALKELKRLYPGKEIYGYCMDVTKKADVRKTGNALLKKLGHVDVLINNAAKDPKVKNTPGASAFIRLENYPDEIWDEELSVGLKGAFLCSQFFGAVMAEKGRGVILNISSDLGIIAPDQRIYRKEGLPEEKQPVKPVTYSVIKHGIIGLTKYLATYWAGKGIRVNAICPSGVYTDQPTDFIKKLTNLIPMGRMAEADEYKAAVLFLISDASSYMTGATLVIDGGRTCW